jgi:hypothetical protein
MKAGRELDALIAEKVMGWSSQADGLYWDAGNHRTRLVLGSIIAKKRDEMGLENAHGFVFAPSTNIADAWEVVPVLDQRLDQFWSVVRAGEKFEFYSNPYELGDYTAYVEAGTLPLLLCLAALKVVSQEGQG